MSLSLVDYGSSSDSEDDQQQNSPINTTKTNGSGLNQLLPPPKNNKANTTTKKSIFYIPSAKELDAADEVEEEKPSKRLKIGTASSNLADLLPAPKNNLNPFRKPATTAAPLPTSQSTNKTHTTTTIEDHDDGNDSDNNLESDDDQHLVEEHEEHTKTTASKFTGSFFHIGSKLKEQPTTASASVKKSSGNGDQQIQQEYQELEQQQQQQLPVLEDPNAMYAYGADPNAYHQYYYQQQQEDASNKETLDYDVLSQLGGKRRGENAGVNIIDVNQTDILPSDEWRRQAEAQQPKLAATSTPASFDVNSAKKKKNNIMALAAQAKSMESTLEERYAQQRIAKNQARNRYGF